MEFFGKAEEKSATLLRNGSTQSDTLPNGHGNVLGTAITQSDTQMQDAPAAYSTPYLQSQRPSTSAPLSNLSLEAISLRVEEALRPAQTQHDPNVESMEPRSSLVGFEVAMQPTGGIAPSAQDPLSISKTPSARGGGRRNRGLRRKLSPSVSDTIVVNEGSFTPSEAASAPDRRKSGTRGRPRGSRAARGSTRGTKRKRTQSGAGDIAGDTDSSETFSPLPSQSRSGRKIFQAPAADSPTIKAETGAALEPKGPTLRGSGRKRGAGRRAPAGPGVVCLGCGRGHSPLTNAIVFCDGCNRPWHQYCHVPPIKAVITEIAEMEWQCTNCTVLKEESARLQHRVVGGSMSLLEVSDATQQTISPGGHPDILNAETRILPDASPERARVVASPRLSYASRPPLLLYQKAKRFPIARQARR